MPSLLLTPALYLLVGFAFLALALYLFLSRRSKTGADRHRLTIKSAGRTALCAVAGVIVLACGLRTGPNEPQEAAQPEPDQPAEIEKVRRRFLRQYQTRTAAGLSVGALVGLSGSPAVACSNGAGGLSFILPWYEPTDVSLTDLLADPAQYDGRLLRVRGKVRGNVGQHEQSPKILLPFVRLILLADGRHLQVMTVGPDPLKAGGRQLAVTGIFHDDETAWLEAFPESGGRVEAGRGDDSTGR
jgi:hypothetical protein